METESRWRVSPASADIPADSLAAQGLAAPWRTIWFSPRRTIRQLLAMEDPPSWTPVYAVAVLAGWMDSVNSYWANGRLSAVVLVGLTALYIALVPLSLWLSTWFLAVYGRWRGGRGTAGQLRLAFGWSTAPLAITVVCWGLIWVLNGGPIDDDLAAESAGQIAALLLYFVIGVAQLWAGILCVPAIAEAHRFSLGKAFEAIVCTAVAAVLVLLASLALSVGALRAVR